MRLRIVPFTCLLLTLHCAFGQPIRLSNDISLGVLHNDQYYFYKNNKTELWLSDGTLVGTKYIDSIPGGSPELFVFDNRIFLKCNSPLANYEITQLGLVKLNFHLEGSGALRAKNHYYRIANSILFKHAVSFQVEDSLDFNGLDLSSILFHNDSIFAIGNDGLFKVDTLFTGWEKISDLSFSSFSYQTNEFIFLLRNESELWKSDGTYNGTTLCLQIDPIRYGKIVKHALWKGDQYFVTGTWDYSSFQLWKISLDASVNKIFEERSYYGAYKNDVWAYDDKRMVFRIWSHLSTFDLWSTDGISITEKIYTPEKEINSNSGVTRFPAKVRLNDYWYFLKAPSQKYHYSIMKTDGTLNGTLPVTVNDSIVSQLQVFKNRLYYLKKDYRGIQPWTSSGETENKQLFIDFNEIAASSEVNQIRTGIDHIFFSMKSPFKIGVASGIDSVVVYEMDNIENEFSLGFFQIGKKMAFYHNRTLIGVNRDVYELWGFEKYMYNTITRADHRSPKDVIVASPNPFETKVSIHFGEILFGKAEIVLLDAIGRSVWKSSQIDISFQKELEIGSVDLPSGIYICNIYLNEKLTRSVRLLKY